MLCKGSSCRVGPRCGLLLRRFLASPSPWVKARFARTATTITSSSSSGTTVGKLVYDNNKAGLQKVDKAHVQEVINKLSKGSAFYNKEQRQQADRAARNAITVAKAKQYAFHATPAERQAVRERLEAYETQVESTRDFSRCFIHVDMDMFYAAVEEKHNPDLKDIPFAVGSFTMLSTSNYIARQYGIRAGMPGFIAKKLCPRLRIVPVNFDYYRAEAATVRDIAKSYDPNFVSVGLDEVTMEITTYLQAHGGVTPEDVCQAFRAEVFAQTGLTCSGGISHTAAFSKIASNVNKPNGQHHILLHTRAEVLNFVKNMSVREVPGIGLAQEELLGSLQIKTCSDLHKKRELLCHVFKEKTFLNYLSASLGLSRTHVDRTIATKASEAEANATSKKSSRAVLPAQQQQQLRKSISKEKTFYRRLRSEDALSESIVSLVTELHDALLSDRQVAACVTFYVKDRSFETASFQKTLATGTNDFGILLRAAQDLAKDKISLYKSYRLIGVRLTKLSVGGAGSNNTKKKQLMRQDVTGRDGGHPLSRRMKSQKHVVADKKKTRIVAVSKSRETKKPKPHNSHRYSQSTVLV